MNALTEIDLLRRIADPDTLIAVYQHAKYLHAKTHRKPLSQSEKRRRDDRNRKFAETQKRNRPEGRKGLFGIRVAPRPALNARKAKKYMLNGNHSPSKTIKPKKATKSTRK